MPNTKATKEKILAFIVILAMLILGGCTKIIFKAAYNNADWFLKTQFDKYLDTTWRQDDILGDSLEVFLDNHRIYELPLVYDFLEDIKQKVKRPSITIDDVYDTTNKFVIIRNRLVSTLFNDEMTIFLGSLTIEQVNFFERNINKYLQPQPGDDDKTFLERTDQENQNYYFNKRKESIITWLGSINPKQEQLLRDFPLLDRRNSQLFYQERLRISNLLVDRLKQQVLVDKDPEITINIMREWFTDFRSQYSEEFRETSSQRSKLVHQFFLDLDKSLTPEQEAFLIEQLEYYQEIISELNRET